MEHREMVRRIAVLVAAVVMATGVACASSTTAADSPAESASETETAVFEIEGMSCMSCAGTVASALDDHEGVQSVDVDIGDDRAVVDYEVERVEIGALAEALEEAGYPATVIESR